MLLYQDSGDRRFRKAHEVLTRATIWKEEDCYKIRSVSSRSVHTVKKKDGRWQCTCQDCRIRRVVCKHILAVITKEELGNYNASRHLHHAVHYSKYVKKGPKVKYTEDVDSLTCRLCQRLIELEVIQKL